MYVQRNSEERSRNHICSGKAISITYWGACVRASDRESGRVRVRACM
jgi:hypothetical protein